MYYTNVLSKDSKENKTLGQRAFKRLNKRGSKNRAKSFLLRNLQLWPQNVVNDTGQFSSNATQHAVYSFITSLLAPKKVSALRGASVISCASSLSNY